MHGVCVVFEKAQVSTQALPTLLRRSLPSNGRRDTALALRGSRDDVSEVSEICALLQSVDRLIVNENIDERLHLRAAVLMRPSAACNILQMSSCRAEFGCASTQVSKLYFG